MVSPGFQRVPPARCTKFIEAPAVSPRPPPSVPRWFGRRLPHRWHRRWLPTFGHIAPDGTGRDLGNNNVPLVKKIGGRELVYHLSSFTCWWCNNHLEKYESMGRIIPYIVENKKWLKPTTRQVLNLTGPDGTLGPWDLASGSELILDILVARFRT